MGGNLTIFYKDHNIVEEAGRKSARSKVLAAKHTLRYNYYVQLVAIWRARVL